MRSQDIQSLLKTDARAKSFFDKLPADIQSGLMAHGSGINNLVELQHFAGSLQKNGGRP